jgi:hypothetical protein
MLDELSKLKDWQPLIAALVVFGGAVIAYNAAMAKVKLDRELADRVVLRSRVALYLRLMFAVKLLRQECDRLAAFIRPGLYVNNQIRSSDLVLEEPQELIEAWASLDAFDLSTIAVLQDIRSSLRDWKTLLSPYAGKAGTQWEAKKLLPTDLPWRLCESAKAISSMCDMASQRLSEKTENAMAKLGS